MLGHYESGLVLMGCENKLEDQEEDSDQIEEVCVATGIIIIHQL